MKKEKKNLAAKQWKPKQNKNTATIGKKTAPQTTTRHQQSMTKRVYTYQQEDQTTQSCVQPHILTAAKIPTIN